MTTAWRMLWGLVACGLIWQAVVQRKIEKNASPDERQLAFDRMVAKALEDFPPK